MLVIQQVSSLFCDFIPFIKVQDVLWKWIDLLNNAPYCRIVEATLDVLSFDTALTWKFINDLMAAITNRLLASSV